MDPVAAPGVYQGVANVIAAVMLLIEFGMLRQALARSSVKDAVAEIASVSGLARKEIYRRALELSQDGDA